MKMAFLHICEIVGGYLEQAEHHTLLTEGIISFLVSPPFCYVFTNLHHILSLSLCTHTGNYEINLKTPCFVMLAFVTCGCKVI